MCPQSEQHFIHFSDLSKHGEFGEQNVIRTEKRSNQSRPLKIRPPD
jgi:hypothetical protein